MQAYIYLGERFTATAATATAQGELRQGLMVHLRTLSAQLATSEERAVGETELGRIVRALQEMAAREGVDQSAVERYRLVSK